jgi:hypothetical protein
MLGKIYWLDETEYAGTDAKESSVNVFSRCLVGIQAETQNILGYFVVLL